MKTKNVKTPARRKTPRNGKLDNPLSITKIRAIYAGEWLAVHLTKVDRYNNPIAGVVVAHSRSDVDLMRQAEQYRLKNPKAKVYTFVAGSYFPEGVAVVLKIGQSNCWTL